jgi:hypothetical protein
LVSVPSPPEYAKINENRQKTIPATDVILNELIIISPPNNIYFFLLHVLFKTDFTISHP